MIRQPAVAGHFYNSSSSKLSQQVDNYIRSDVEKESALGIVSPHAGLMYSGAVAGEVYSRIKFPQTFILLGPNHTGLGSTVSIMSSGVWKMPTGDLSIDEEVAGKLKERSDIFKEDSTAHSMEHSLEVQLPFILTFSKNVKIVPIIMMSDSLDDCRSIGEAIASVISETEYPVTITASSDMSHYVSDETARKKDKMAIDKILALDPEGLHETVRRESITMCGVIPATTMLIASKKLGADRAELVRYMTSGEVSGDYDYVVGYAGLMIKK
jgi:AmmeMemoRadiSam system protein B